MMQTKKWHRRQSSPATGNISARPGRSALGVFPSSRRIATIPDRCRLQRTILGPQYAFSRHGGIYRSDVVRRQPILGRGPTSSRRSAPGPGKRTRREDHALLIVRDEFRSGYSLIGLLASIARLRFPGRRRLPCAPRRPRLKGTFLLCQEGDISTLP